MQPYFPPSRTVFGISLMAVGLCVGGAAHGQAGYAASHYAAQQVQPEYYATPSYPQQMAAYEPAYQEAPVAMPVMRAEPVSLVHFDGRYATPSPYLPVQVQYAVNAANYLQHKPYVYGGGHQYIESNSYDCSSAVSYALIKGGMLLKPLTSVNFARFGAPGQGRFITIWVKPGHVFMTVCGLRLDTTGGRAREGPRWRTADRSYSGFTPRHPVGL